MDEETGAVLRHKVALGAFCVSLLLKDVHLSLLDILAHPLNEVAGQQNLLRDPASKH